jgi:short-subunit dehydrogenase
VFAGSLRQEIATSGVGVTVVVPAVVETGFFERRGRLYERHHPRPLPVDRVAGAIVSAIERGSPEVYLPRWMQLPVLVASAFPALYRRLAARFG